MNGMVRTVLGDVDASDLGVSYMHEHLIIDSAAVADRWPHILLTSTDDAVAEVDLCRHAGVGSMVDAMPMASGRRPLQLVEISRRTGVHIVMTTGLHTEKYYTDLPWVESASADQLADWFIRDIVEGIDAEDHLGPEPCRTGVRAGMIKVATSDAGITDRAIGLFDAAWAAMSATGVPMLTHCEEGVRAMEQVDALTDIGIPLERVVMSHTDKVDDPAYHTDLLETGVNLEFDQAVRQGQASVDGTAKLLATQLERGFVKQLMLGTDGARRSLWSVYGHDLGLAWMAGGYRAILDQFDIDEDMQKTMFVDNPARLLTMHTPTNPVRHTTNEAVTEKERV